jgi:hypothetical protein
MGERQRHHAGRAGALRRSGHDLQHNPGVRLAVAASPVWGTGSDRRRQDRDPRDRGPHDPAVDAEDYAAYVDHYLPDGAYQTNFAGGAIGHEEILAWLERMRPGIVGKRHVVSNLVVDGEAIGP